ncbi:MAG: tetratricopeptide repeat protein, partial [Candidatus Thorarchaeota archaeon]|nr:tetratricopeptide repeat protein [Candidatus Thorarchaeota archaeon]
MTYSEEDIQAMIEDLKENPDDSTKWHLFGVALLSIGRYDEAENAFRHCMKIDKNNAFALGDLGGLYILKRKPKDAIKYLENSVRLMPENHEYWSALGIAYLQRNKYKDALKAFEKSLSIEPDHLDSIISLGLIY